MCNVNRCCIYRSMCDNRVNICHRVYAIMINYHFRGKNNCIHAKNVRVGLQRNTKRLLSNPSVKSWNLDKLRIWYPTGTQHGQATMIIYLDSRLPSSVSSTFMTSLSFSVRMFDKQMS